MLLFLAPFVFLVHCQCLQHLLLGVLQLTLREVEWLTLHKLCRLMRVRKVMHRLKLLGMLNVLIRLWLRLLNLRNWLNLRVLKLVPDVGSLIPEKEMIIRSHNVGSR